MRNPPGHITVLVKRAKRVPHKSRAAGLTLDNPAKPGKARPYRPSTIQPPSTRLNRTAVFRASSAIRLARSWSRGLSGLSSFVSKSSSPNSPGLFNKAFVLLKFSVVNHRLEQWNAGAQERWRLTTTNAKHGSRSTRSCLRCAALNPF
jgi:hypothetical protein